MKWTRLSILFFMLFTFFSCNAYKVIDKPLDGLFDIKWGNNQKTVKEIMLKRGNVKFYYNNSDSTMTFSGGTFGEKEVDSYDFYFVANKFYKGYINIIGSISDYHYMVKILEQKYGKHYYSDNKNLKDGYYTSWKFKSSSKMSNSLACFYKGGMVRVIYTNSELAALKNKFDYKKYKEDIEKGIKDI